MRTEAQFSPGTSPLRRTSGVALILTLSLIVVATVIVTAFFFRSRFDSQGSASYTSQVSATQLAELGSAKVIASLVAEAEEGASDVVTNPNTGDQVFVVTDPQNMLVKRQIQGSVAAGTPGTGFSSLVKQSVPAMDRASIGLTVSPIPTYDASRISKSSYRPLDGSYWSRPMLTVDDFDNSQVPQWVYVNASGESVTDAPDKDAKPEAKVAGRFAFNVYDVGGLLDINAAGYNLDAGELAKRKGSLLYADLPGLATEVGATSLTPEKVADLNAWRYKNFSWAPGSSPVNSNNPVAPSEELSALMRSGPMFASLGKYPPGLDSTIGRQDKNAFLSRSDVIRYFEDKLGPTQARLLLPYLTHYTRGLDQPYFIWDWATRPRPAANENFFLKSGNNPALVNANPWSDEGTFRLFQRFPLDRLALLRLDETGNQPEGDENLIRRYFGLRRGNDEAGRPRWEYDPVHKGTGAGEPFRLLSELDGITAKDLQSDPSLAPNFFEMLYYAISSGSIGQQFGGVAPTVTGNSPNAPHARIASSQWSRNFDASTIMHVMRIGAAIIDQWDADPFPTRISFGERTVFGIEDLPYLHGFKRMNYFGVPAYTLKYTGGELKVVECASFMHPQLWNPFSSESGPTTPAAPKRFRVVPHTRVLEDGDPYVEKRRWGFGSDFNRRLFFPQNFPVHDSANGGRNFNLLKNQRENTPNFDANDINSLPYGGNWDAVETNVDLDQTDYVQIDASAADVNVFRKPFLAWTSPPVRGGGPPVDGIAIETYQAGELRDPFPLNSNINLNINANTSTTIRLPRVGFRIGKYLCENIVNTGRPAGQNQSDFLGINYGANIADTEIRVSFRVEYQSPDGRWLPYDIMYDAVDFYTLDNGSQDQVWRVMGLDHDATFRADPTVGRFGPQSLAYRSRSIADAAKIQNFPPNSTGWTSAGRWVYRNTLGGKTTTAGVSIDGGGEPKSQQGYNFFMRSGAPPTWPLGTFKDLREYDWLRTGTFAKFSRTAPDLGGYLDPDLQLRFPDATEAWTGNPNGEESPVKMEDQEAYQPAKHDKARPIILNRPFQSVAEMSYASRDLPWKTLDFWNANSGDSALLDYFCLNSSEIDAGATPIIAGVVNPNTASPVVLAALISGASKDVKRDGSAAIDWTQALKIAESLSAYLQSTSSDAGPLRSRAEIIGRWDSSLKKFTGPWTGTFVGTTRSENAGSQATRDALGNDVAFYEPRRVSLVRALADNAEPRVWNLLIDITAQSGRISPNTTDLEDFVVEGSVRQWIFVAIDRMTGKILDQRLEDAN